MPFLCHTVSIFYIWLLLTARFVKVIHIIQYRILHVLRKIFFLNQHFPKPLQLSQIEHVPTQNLKVVLTTGRKLQNFWKDAQ